MVQGIFLHQGLLEALGSSQIKTQRQVDEGPLKGLYFEIKTWIRVG